MNKNGQIEDVFILGGIVFAAIVVFGVLIYASYTIGDTLDVVQSHIENSINITEPRHQTIDKATGTTITFLPWALLSLLIGNILFIMISNIFVRSHPLIFIVYIIIAFVSVFFAVPLSNYYESYLVTTSIGQSLSDIGIFNFIALNLPVILFFVALLGGVSLAINLLTDSSGGLGI